MPFRKRLSEELVNIYGVQDKKKKVKNRSQRARTQDEEPSLPSTLKINGSSGLSAEFKKPDIQVSKLWIKGD